MESQASVRRSVQVALPEFSRKRTLSIAYCRWWEGGICILVGMFLATYFLATHTIAAQQPNIVFIMADDLGWSDTSNALTNQGHPSDFYQTPTLEMLAAQGMAFTNAYTSGPNCAPTRSALLTGQYAQRPTNNVYLVDKLNRGGNQTLLVGPDQGLPNKVDAIPNDAFTYGEMLQSAGYRTGYFGKFHVVDTTTPAGADIVTYHGFDENFGGTTKGGPKRYHAVNQKFSDNISPSLDPFATDYTQAYVDANIKPYANGTSMAEIDALVGTAKHVTDATADAAIDFMERHKNAPFLMNMSPHAVHAPIDNAHARSDLLSKYEGLSVGQQDSNRSFAAILEGLDQSIARVVDYLKTTPDPNRSGSMLSENTLVLFYSDNGGFEDQSNNGPLRGQKGELTEGGIRVPLIAWSENESLVEGGTINDTPVQSIDFYKTFASLAGATLPTSVLDGEDLRPVIADASAALDRNELFWHVPGYLKGAGRDLRPASIIRQGHHKLWYHHESQSFQLFDLQEDIGEADDIAQSEPERVAEMGAKLVTWLADTQAPLTTLRTGTLDVVLNGIVYHNGETSQRYFESLTIEAGEEVPVIGDVYSLADLDRDKSVDVLDWMQFKVGRGLDMSGMLVRDAYRMGDLDHDFDNDHDDFLLFRNAFDAYNGEGAFAAIVPEPSGWATILLGALLVGGWRRGIAGNHAVSRHAPVSHRAPTVWRPDSRT